ncbi:hypothetical protein AVEN_34480-1 [Araneus ventricosus]|uniref:Uncharacterized protein n=1 Tax=Araneus ventricosus TaxID=182803 RepID=A0A4Y2S709_ARAVE|nr:hypothetical protein AVEN_34480-1 [Araneus ventricosus]
MFSLPARTFSHEKRGVYFPLRPQIASLPHLLVIKRTFAKVIAARGERPQYAGINNCQRAHIFSYHEISGILSCYTCIDFLVMKPSNLPTVGIDPWGDKTFSRWSHGRLGFQWKPR